MKKSRLQLYILINAVVSYIIEYLYSLFYIIKWLINYVYIIYGSKN